MNASGDFTFRLAGTRVCALFCRELKGEDFVGLFGGDSRRQVEDVLGIVCDEAIATVGVAAARPADVAVAELELLLLPLRHRGHADSRILGALAAVSPPYWIGTVPIASLTLENLRLCRPASEPAGFPMMKPAPRIGRTRHGLVIYDGGRR